MRKAINPVKLVGPDLRQNGGPSVYFLSSKCLPFVKVGCAQDWYARCADIQVSSPFDLEVILLLPGFREEEKAVHQSFAGHLRRGEWFYLSDFVLESIDMLKSGITPQQLSKLRIAEGRAAMNSRLCEAGYEHLCVEVVEEDLLLLNRLVEEVRS